VELRKLGKVAGYLREALGFDWLENLSVAQVDDALVLTYFLRAGATREQLILKATVVPADARAEAEAPSVSALWPPAALMEQEAGELFGIRFQGAAEGGVRARRLPEGWSGFPLRKGYEFPREVDGIAHARPAEARHAEAPAAPETRV
jgi:NADH:ubiquinone oxidoreductase subunit C